MVLCCCVVYVLVGLVLCFVRSSFVVFVHVLLGLWYLFVFVLVLLLLLCVVVLCLMGLVVSGIEYRCLLLFVVVVGCLFLLL